MRVPWLRLGLGLLVVGGVASSLARAELKVCKKQYPLPGTVQTSKSDTPDPFPVAWLKLTPPDAPDSCCLNPNGDIQHDQWPDFVINVSTGEAEATWGWNTGNGYQIAFSETDDGEWSATVFLTTDGDNQDPRIVMRATGSGTKIVFWREGVPRQVMITERAAAGAPWSSPTPVSNGLLSSLWPSAVISGGKIHVAYEAERPSGGKDIIVAGRDENTPAAPFQTEVIAQTPRTGKLAAQLNVRGGRVWMTWIQSATQLGWSKLDGILWQPPSYKPFTLCTTVEEGQTVENVDHCEALEAARFAVSREVLAAP